MAQGYWPGTDTSNPPQHSPEFLMKRIHGGRSSSSVYSSRNRGPIRVSSDSRRWTVRGPWWQQRPQLTQSAPSGSGSRVGKTGGRGIYRFSPPETKHEARSILSKRSERRVGREPRTPRSGLGSAYRLIRKTANRSINDLESYLVPLARFILQAR